MWGPWYVDIQWLVYHPALPSAGIGWLASAWLPKSYKNQFLSLRNSVQTYDISRHLTAQLQAAECSDSIHVHYQYELSLYMKERTLPNLPTEDIEVHGEQSNVFPGGTMVTGQLSKKETHPRRPAMPKQERGSPRHPWGSKKICSFVNSAHGGEQKGEHSKVPRAHDNSMYQGYMTFCECQGHALSFKIMRPHHWCWTPPGQVRLALCIAATPLPIRVGATYLDYLWFTTFNLPFFVTSAWPSV